MTVDYFRRHDSLSRVALNVVVLYFISDLTGIGYRTPWLLKVIGGQNRRQLTFSSFLNIILFA
jgi:hypothetical protein